jgi:hypothetical protein
MEKFRRGGVVRSTLLSDDVRGKAAVIVSDLIGTSETQTTAVECSAEAEASTDRLANGFMLSKRHAGCRCRDTTIKARWPDRLISPKLSAKAEPVTATGTASPAAEVCMRAASQ